MKNRSFELCWRWVCNLDEEMGLFVFCSVSGWGPQFWQKVWLKRRDMWLSIETKWVLFWVSEKIEFEWWVMGDENFILSEWKNRVWVMNNVWWKLSDHFFNPTSPKRLHPITRISLSLSLAWNSPSSHRSVIYSTKGQRLFQ